MSCWQKLYALLPILQISYGYSKERFVWSLISAVGIFCLGADATIFNGIQNLWTSQSLIFIVAAASLVAVSTTGNAIYDPVGSVVVAKSTSELHPCPTVSSSCKEPRQFRFAGNDGELWLEKEIQELVPGIRHVDIEAHSRTGSSP
ncbi:Metal tolerance protein C4, partial [Cucurbita argyrosperma subsp. sororia]